MRVRPNARPAQARQGGGGTFVVVVCAIILAVGMASSTVRSASTGTAIVHGDQAYANYLSAATGQRINPWENLIVAGDGGVRLRQPLTTSDCEPTCVIVQTNDNQITLILPPNFYWYANAYSDVGATASVHALTYWNADQFAGITVEQAFLAPTVVLPPAIWRGYIEDAAVNQVVYVSIGSLRQTNHGLVLLPRSPIARQADSNDAFISSLSLRAVKQADTSFAICLTDTTQVAHDDQATGSLVASTTAC